GSAGNVVIAAFFVMLFFAALTSAISLLEVVAAAVIDSWGWSRVKAAGVFGAVIAAVGVPSAYSLNFLDVMDKFVGVFLLILGGLLTSILVGYRILPQADAELSEGLQNEIARKVWAFLVRYFAPPVLFVVLILTVPKVLQAVRALIGM
ncbi:MAG: sodium-dependent transporter, partial [Planctomycetota bacterium]